MRLKTLALHAQWIKRFIFYPPTSGVVFSRFMFAVVLEALSRKSCLFPLSTFCIFFLLFFASLLESWALLGGHSRGGTYFLRPTDDGKERPLSALTTKLCYTKFFLILLPLSRTSDQ